VPWEKFSSYVFEISPAGRLVVARNAIKVKPGDNFILTGMKEIKGIKPLILSLVSTFRFLVTGQL